jgi:hypothetical protein
MAYRTVRTPFGEAGKLDLAAKAVKGIRLAAGVGPDVA